MPDTVGKEREMKGVGGGHRGPSGACVSVRHLTTTADGNNNNSYMCQNGESDGAKGMQGEQGEQGADLCFHMRAVGFLGVGKCYGNAWV